MYGYESWTIKKAEGQKLMLLNCGVGEDFWEYCKKSKPVSPKENQTWIFIRRSVAEVEAPILWPADVKSWLTGKDPDVRKYGNQKEKGATDDRIVR